MTTEITSPVAEERGEVHDAASVAEARRILESFYRMQPNLSGLARALTGRRDLHVMPTHAGTFTDNRNIYLSLSPMMLINIEHRRHECGERDERGVQKCLACNRFEQVIVHLYHEMGHIIFDSFTSMTEDERIEIMKKSAFKENKFGWPEEYADWMKLKYAEDPPTSYLEWAQFINPFFPMLLNAMEDSRVNAGIIRKNPGAGRMFRADVVNILDGGVEDAYGNKTMWYEQPLNAQLGIGCLLVASAIDVEPHWLHPAVIEAISDEKLHGLLVDMAQSESAREVFIKSLDVFARGRELGFWQTSDEVSKVYTLSGKGVGSGSDAESGDSSSGSGGEPSDDDSDSADQDGGDQVDEDRDGDDQESSSDDGGDGDGDGGVDEDDGNDAGKDDGTSDTDREAVGADLDDEKGPSMGDAESSEAVLAAFNPHPEPPEDGEVKLAEESNTFMERAIRQEEWDETSESLFGVDLRVPEKPETGWRAVFRDPNPKVIADPAIIQKALGPLRVAFSENARGGYDRNKRAGRIDSRVLGRRVPANDTRLFRKKWEPGKRDYHVTIGIDISGSTSYAPYGTGVSALQLLATCSLLQAEMLARLDVPFEVYAHTGGILPAGKTWEDMGRKGYSLNIFRIKAINEPFNDEVRNRIRSLKSASANLDGHTMEFYRKCLDASSATDRLIIYYTDGAMPAENYDEELAILKRECATIKKRGYDVLAVGIRNDDPQQYGLDTVRVDTPDQVQRVVIELMKRMR